MQAGKKEEEKKLKHMKIIAHRTQKEAIST